MAYWSRVRLSYTKTEVIKPCHWQTKRINKQKHTTPSLSKKRKYKRSAIFFIPYLDSSVFLVPYPPIFILTERNKKACHPLFGIISSLCNHFNNLPRLFKIKLEILAAIVLPRWPASTVSSCDSLMQPGSPGSVVFVPWAGSRDVACATPSAWNATWSYGSLTD